MIDLSFDINRERDQIFLIIDYAILRVFMGSYNFQSIINDSSMWINLPLMLMLVFLTFIWMIVLWSLMVIDQKTNIFIDIPRKV
jgi:hypothetical protein